MYDFERFGNPKCPVFINVMERMITLSKKTAKMFGDSSVSIYLDKKNMAILLKKDYSGRIINVGKEKSCISAATSMQRGRYCYQGEYGGGFLFKRNE